MSCGDPHETPCSEVLDAVYLFGVSEARRRAREEEADILARTGEPEQLGHSQET